MLPNNVKDDTENEKRSIKTVVLQWKSASVWSLKCLSCWERFE